MKYLALGDSYTIGEGVAFEENFPSLFIALLKLENIAVESLEIIAKTGWRTDELILSAKENTNIDYDLISLLIGVNNQHQHKSIEVFKNELQYLIEFALSKVKNRNLVIFTIPDYSYTPFGQDFPNASAEIDLFNFEITKLAQKHQIHLLDINPLTKTTDLSFVAEDNLHPSPKMYLLWAKKLLEQQLSLFATKDNL